MEEQVDKQMISKHGNRYCRVAIDKILWKLKEQGTNLCLEIRESFLEAMTLS